VDGLRHDDGDLVDIDAEGEPVLHMQALYDQHNKSFVTLQQHGSQHHDGLDSGDQGESAGRQLQEALQTEESKHMAMKPMSKLDIDSNENHLMN